MGKKQRRTWQEAVVRFLQEKQHKKSLESDIWRFKYLNGALGGKYLDEITIETVNQIKEDYSATGVKNTTLNRMMGLLRSVLMLAMHEWEWLDKVPKVKLLQEPKRRVRFLKPEEIARLMQELPDHLKAMAKFSLATGLRESNVTQLQWEQVDMQRHCAWIYADQSKTGRAINVPLNDNALEVVREQLGKHIKYVFVYEGHPVTRANNHAWRNALKRAGIEDFRWHDLRHCFASAHAMNGTPLHVLQALGGWESQEMVQRYAHLSSAHLLEFAGNSKTKL